MPHVERHTLEVVPNSSPAASVRGDEHSDGIGSPPRPAHNEPSSGTGRALIAVYLILAVAATARSVLQLTRRFEEAPLAYSLSAVAAAVYILASIALIRRRGVWRTVAWITLCFELIGVLVVGTLSFTHPDLFQHASVWSSYGIGYLYVPLVLPILGMVWLAREASRGASDGGGSRRA